MPVMILGLQRSGTNMVVRGFRSNPEFDVFNETDRRAFSNFRIRSLATVQELVAASRHRWALFMPLRDSDLAREMLSLETGKPVRMLWVHRGVDAQARSALAQFGEANLQALRRIAAGEQDIWQAGGISPANLELVCSLDFSSLTPDDGAALFWYIRNSLFFDMGLDARLDVLAVSCERLTAAPEEVIGGVCNFLWCKQDPRFSSHIERREPSDLPPLVINPDIRERCAELQGRFDRLAPPP